MSKLITKYKNGNYTVRLYDDGTKIKLTKDNEFIPEFPECIDCNISTKCDGHCEYCYLNCNENGIHADLTDPIFDTLHSGIELAINANDLTHPQLEDFLIRMKEKGVIVNLTINQKHLRKNESKLKDWQDRQLVWGIGVSLIDSTDDILWNNSLKNVIIHVIDGCFCKDDLENLKNHNIKLLILGYKIKGRGIDYYEKHKDLIYQNIDFLDDHLYDYRPYFSGFAFDNLAIEHLSIELKVDEEQWKKHHMGEEGESTFFYDATNKTFAISSMSEKSYDALNSFNDMFHFIRKVCEFE